MDPRVRTLLSWQMRFQSRRMSTWVMGGGYVLAALLFMGVPSRMPAALAGQAPFRVLQTVHALAAAFFAIRLATQSLEDNASGTLGFLKIANLEPGDWVTFRFLSLLIGYLPVWLLRLPFYMLVLSLGGVMLSDILWLEAVQWVTFLSIGSLALLVARYSATGSSIAVATLLVVWLWQVVLFFPLMALALLNALGYLLFSEISQPWAVAIGQMALPKYFWRLPADSLEWTMALAGFALHLGLALFLLRLLARTVYVNAGTEMSTEEPVLTKAERRSTTRPSRRVDDDALAWQACHVHSGLSLQARFTATLFSSSAVLFCAFVTVHDPVLRSILIAVSCGFTLIVLAFKPSDCLSREVKGKTLSTLALLPLDGREIYQAWQRGARRMARSTYVAVAAGGIVLTVIAPDAAPFLWMAFAFAVVLLPEIAFLSNVLSQKTTFLDAFLDQVLMAIGIIALICVTLAISIPISMGFHPWAGLMTFVAISLAGRSLLMGELASFVADRIEREQ